ncbi:hypothetical protein LIER_37303 [Lithospermum erythrorhizon]|uniref:Bidirectional sugar transporter SWEET n=1 Tax=Lithospermum erythrorhizon TaxID=34254 RepID=A0AAV3PMI7_LITER
MAVVWTVEHLAFIFGLLGNIVSFMVFLAPVPTFHKICKRKSSDGFQSIPYAVALFSASLLLYYAYLKKNAFMIVTINGIGCVIEITYLFIYLFYASKKYRIIAFRFILLLNVGAQGLVMLCSLLLVKGQNRKTMVGWVCAAVNLAVFAAPLSIMRQVIRTKSVEFMPFTLSLFLTLCATMWFFYGFFISDYYIALPNVIGFILGIAQMGLYLIYKNARKDNDEKNFKFERQYEKDMMLEGTEDSQKDVEMNLKVNKTANGMSMMMKNKDEKQPQYASTKQDMNDREMFNVRVEE